LWTHLAGHIKAVFYHLRGVKAFVDTPSWAHSWTHLAGHTRSNILYRGGVKMREVLVSNHLFRKYREANREALVNGLKAAGSALAGLLMLFFYPLLAIPGFIACAVFIYLLSEQSTRKDRFLRGIEGEFRLRNRLREILPDSYTAYLDVPLTRGDIDCIVEGPSQAYVFEVKSSRGSISYNKDRWDHIITGQRGTEYEGRFSDPLNDPAKQLRTVMEGARGFLRRKGRVMPIKGAVVFSNPSATVEDNVRGDIKVVKVDDVEEVFTPRNAASTVNKEAYAYEF